MFVRPLGISLVLHLMLCSGAVQAAEPVDDNPPQMTLTASSMQVAAAPETTDEKPAPAKKKWEFATIGYAWFAGAWGKTDVIKPVPPVDLDLPFGKVLKAFKFAFMGAAEAKHDRIVILGDLIFIHLDARQGIGIRDPDFLKAELEFKDRRSYLARRVSRRERRPRGGYFLAAGRINSFKTTLQLKGPNAKPTARVRRAGWTP